MRIILPTPHLLSNNRFYAGMNYRVRKNLADEWHLATFIAIRDQSTGEPPNKFPVRIIYLIHPPSKKMDLDNISTKAILDGLVLSEILPDDSLKYVQEIRTIFKGVDKLSPHIEIVIEEMEDAN